MRLFFKAKDGGPDSKVTGYWLIESKILFSIVLLRFDQGSRDWFHNHAFNACSFVLSGELEELEHKGMGRYVKNYLTPSFKPYFTFKHTMHRVTGITPKTWVLSFRGPWDLTWNEFLPSLNKFTTLTNGRVVV